jgi:hypothetical protein
VDGKYYVSLALECSLAVDAGVTASAGNFGVSADISTQDKFRMANYYGVAPAVTLRDAITQAFQSCVLPFHGDSIASLPEGDYVDFEFVGDLSLGFGASYGFSSTFFGGVSNGEVSAFLASPVGKTVLSAAPSYKVGASFNLGFD